MNFTVKCCLVFNLKQLLDYTETVGQVNIFLLLNCAFELCGRISSVSISTCQDAFYDVLFSVLINPTFANTWNLCLFLKLSMTLMYLIQTIC